MKATIKHRLQETKRALILEELDAFFHERGFGNPRMQEIAEALGISVGALYKLFPSKEQLLYEYIAHEIRRFHQELLRRMAALPSPRERLSCFISLKFEVFSLKRSAFEDPILGDPLFFFKMNVHRENPARPIAETLAKELERLSQAERLPCRDCLLGAYLFNGYVTGYIEHWYNEGIEPPEKPERILERFLKGMAP